MVGIIVSILFLFKFQEVESKNKKTRRIYSPAKRKFLLLLGAGVALGLAGSPRSQKYIFKKVRKEWNFIDKDYLYRLIREFRHERLVDFVENGDGSTRIVLSEKGEKRVLEFRIDGLRIKEPLRWDKKGRMEFFDIPEKKRRDRNILREKLKEIGFSEIQKSVFIHPFPCLDEIDFIMEYYKLRNFVRYGEVMNISNEAELKIRFNL